MSFFSELYMRANTPDNQIKELYLNRDGLAWETIDGDGLRRRHTNNNEEQTMEQRITQYSRPVVVPMALTGSAATNQAEHDEVGKRWWDTLDTLAEELDSAYSELMVNKTFGSGLAARLVKFQRCNLEYLEHVATEHGLVARWRERGNLSSGKLVEKLQSGAHQLAVAYYTELVAAGAVDPQLYTEASLVEFWTAMVAHGC